VIAAAIVASLWACGEPSTCPFGIGIDIESFTTDGYNTAIRSSGGGSGVNVNWTCPNGGSATITGTANTQTVTYDVTFTFHQCADFSLGMLTLDGAMHDSVVNGSQSSTKTETIHSDALKINGHETDCKADPIDATCVVDIDDTSSNLSATICGLSSN
jgi:hypothetical protein